VPVRLWFGRVRGTHGVPRADSAGRSAGSRCGKPSVLKIRPVSVRVRLGAQVPGAQLPGNSRFYAEVFERETTKERIRLGTVRPVVDRPVAPWEMPGEDRSCTSTQTVVVRPAADFAVTDIGIVRRGWRYRTLRSTCATQIQPQSATLVYSSSCVQCPASNLMGRVVGSLSA